MVVCYCKVVAAHANGLAGPHACQEATTGPHALGRLGVMTVLFDTPVVVAPDSCDMNDMHHDR